MLQIHDLNGKSVLITGATGLIGRSLIQRFLHLNEVSDSGIQIFAAVRSMEKAQKIWGEDCKKIHFLCGDIKEIRWESQQLDYIIHCASQTSSKGFITNPVETIETSIEGTKNLLQIALKGNVRRFVYLSSMEVYGNPQTDDVIDESHSSNLNWTAIRSCYPLSKQLCENYCLSYMAEYGIPVNIIRLTQTFGPGVTYDDGRVFAEFARSAIEKKDIVLKTKGQTKRMYLYTEDAVNAILYVMLLGTPGEVYNAANPETYCSIYEMAMTVVQKVAGNAIRVTIEEGDASACGFAPTLKMNLSVDKLKKLGWTPEVDLEEMFQNMILQMKKE